MSKKKRTKRFPFSLEKAGKALLFSREEETKKINIFEFSSNNSGKPDQGRPTDLEDLEDLQDLEIPEGRGHCKVSTINVSKMS